MKRILTWIVTFILLCNTTASAFAQTPAQGNPAAALTPAQQTLFSNFQDILVRGDLRVTRNELGTITAELPPGETSEQLFSLAGGSPILWAKYYYGSASGTIQATYLRRDIQTGQINIITENLTPAMGAQFGLGNDITPDYNGTNPFQDFNSGGVYTNINLNGFMAIAGMWAKNRNAQRGYVVATESKFNGVFKWNKCIKKILKACIKKRFHQEAYATVTPAWYVMAPSDVGVGRAMPAGYTSNTCLNTGASIAQCTVRGGMSFIKVTDGNDFPTGTEKFWHYHEYQDGWAGWITGLVAAVVAIISAGTLGAAALAMLAWGAGAAVAALAIQYVVTGVGPTDYQDSVFFGKKVDGKGSSLATGKWSPVGCIGGTTGSSGAKSGGRYGHGECKSFATGDFANTGAGLNTFHADKKQDPQFDWNISNDVQVLRESPTPPTKWDGTPDRF